MRHALLRFYTGEGPLFDNCAVWVPSPDLHDPIFSYPGDTAPCSGTTEHIAFFLNTACDLTAPLFRVVAARPDNEIRVIYTLTCEMKTDIKIGDSSIVLISIESRYFHPLLFHSLAVIIQQELMMSVDFCLSDYHRPHLTQGPGSERFIAPFAFGISADAEIGRLQQFLFSCFRVKHVVTILCHLLASDPIIVTSISLTRLGLGCFALLALLHPFQYPLIFIPLLPESLMGTLGSPFPYLIGVPYTWIEQNNLRGLDPTVVVNLDLGAVISPEPRAAFEPQFAVLQQRIVAKLEEELELYRTYGVFPAARISAVIWEMIAGTLAVAARVAAPVTVVEVASELLRLRESDEAAEEESAHSFRRLILESTVVVYGAEQVQGRANSAAAPHWNEVYREMGDILAAVQKAKK
jgi:hypothetical protein